MINVTFILEHWYGILYKVDPNPDLDPEPQIGNFCFQI